MSLGAWGDESPGAERGSETVLWQDLAVIMGKYDAWLAAAKKNNEFWSPEDEALADEISGQLDKLVDGMNVKF